MLARHHTTITDLQTVPLWAIGFIAYGECEKSACSDATIEHLFGADEPACSCLGQYKYRYNNRLEDRWLSSMFASSPTSQSESRWRDEKREHTACKLASAWNT
jgi:hypothetical protein